MTPLQFPLTVLWAITAWSLDASVIAQRADLTVAASQTAKTDVPVALAGVQGRVALSDRLLAGAAVSTLPRVTINGYTGHALTGGVICGTAVISAPHASQSAP